MIRQLDGRRLGLVLLLCLLFGLTTVPACITDPVTGEKTLGLDMSDDEEVALGNNYAPSFKAQYEGAYPEPELQRHCERIVLGMARTSHRPSSRKALSFGSPLGSLSRARPPAA